MFPSNLEKLLPILTAYCNLPQLSLVFRKLKLCPAKVGCDPTTSLLECDSSLADTNGLNTDPSPRETKSAVKQMVAALPEGTGNAKDGREIQNSNTTKGTQSKESKWLGHKETRFCCKVCGNILPTRKDLKQHNLVHEAERPFKCPTCGKGFTSNQLLIEHEGIHTGDRPYGCDVCGKSYRQRSGLSMHMRTHTGERPHSCSECGKSFMGGSSLKYHMVVHTGEKPFKCETCGAAFGLKANLVRHQVRHTGERPYKCEVCGKKCIALNKVISGRIRRQIKTDRTDTTEIL
uniref:C2H2-type domain-containing protein n=1 Tax=Esox lucius TaxID=8010 RepID=A0AAY5L0F0_ESOLU